MTAEPDQLFSVQVSDDRMVAHIKCLKRGGYADLSPGRVAAPLETAGIEVNDAVAALVHEFAERIRQQGPTVEPFEIAAGKAPTEGSDGRFTWHENYLSNVPQAWQVQDYTDFYDPRSFLHVRRNEIIGRVISKVEGEDGCDVCGETLARKCVPVDLKVSEGVALQPDGQTVIAQIDGKVEIRNNKLTILKCRTIERDIQGPPEPIRTDGAVYVVGSALNVDIVAGGSATIEGTTEAARIFAGHDIVIAEGIIGRNKATIGAGGGIRARYCESAVVKAGSDIRILTRIINSNIHTTGCVDVSTGSIVGGTTYARNGIIAKSIGSDAGVETIVQVGIHPDALARIQDLDKKIKSFESSADRIRTIIQPLMQQIKKLSASQRERATELLGQADDVQAQIETLLKKREEVETTARPSRQACVRVEQTIHEGTILRVGRHERRIDREIRGPVCVELATIKGREVVVSTNTVTNTTRTLP